MIELIAFVAFFVCIGVHAYLTREPKQETEPYIPIPGGRSRSMAAALAFFLGAWGAHRFYVNRPGTGILYALFFWTLIPGTISFFEALEFAAITDREFDLRYNADRMPATR